MKITQDIGIRICGTGSSVPERKISNDDMATIVETNDEWIRTRTGISDRHFADKETNLSLGMEAAEKALEMASISKEEIGVVICATITPDNIVPSQACMLQRNWDCRKRCLPLTSVQPAPDSSTQYTPPVLCCAACRKRNTLWWWQAKC